MKVREFKVSSVDVFSLQCSITSSVFLTVLYKVSFTFDLLGVYRELSRLVIGYRRL